MKIICTLALLALALGQTGLAQGTAFTYQGRLTSGGGAVSGLYDFRFTLHDLASGGLPLEEVPELTNAATVVSDGLFTTTLDFGNQFSGFDRWLEIGVRTNGAGAFTTLAARQKFTPTPYAMYAPYAGYADSTSAGGILGTLSASSIAPGTITSAMLTPGAISGLGSPDGSPANALNVNTNGYVGLGTTNPTAALSLNGGPTQIVPRVLAQIQDGFGSFTDLNQIQSVAVKGNLLAVGATGNDAVTLVNIADPSNPVWTNSLRDGTGVFTNLDGVFSVAFSSTSNLLAIAAAFDDTVTLVDVNNPGSPVKRAELRDGVGSFLELAFVRSVAFSSNLLAIAASGDDAVTLVDVSNPASPVFRIAMKDGQFGFNDLDGVYHVAISGNLLAIAAFADNAVTLVDVSIPTSPILRAVLKDGVGGYNDLANTYAVAFSGNLLAISAYADDAVTLVDVSNPASPIRRAVLKDGVGGFNYLNGATAVTFSGNLLTICSEHDSAVTLVDVSNPASPQLRGVARNGVGDAYLLNTPSSVAFAGTNLVVGAASSSAFTILAPELQTMGLSSAGWVGIGVAAPQAALHVSGSVIVESATLFQIQAQRIELGIGALARGVGAVAMGSNAKASGINSLALGKDTVASGIYSTAMGYATTASGDLSTAMGNNTDASGVYSTAMGFYTAASGVSSTAMGNFTDASGDNSTAMGNSTTASGFYSTAMGYGAKATNSGSFVWSDANGLPGIASASANSVTMRAAGGYRLFSNAGASAGVFLAANGTSWGVLSDRNVKKDFAPVNAVAVLEKLAGMPITQWRYNWETGNETPHIGPMAQDFKAAFYPGSDDKSITTLEADGVAFAAIQGLNEKLEIGNRKAEEREASLRSELKHRDAENAKLRHQNQSLERRLERLEQLLAKPAH